MVKRTITITTVLLILSMIVSLIIILNKSSFAADDDIASGTSGTCSWLIDSQGVLTISPTDGVSGILDTITTNGNAPWYTNREAVKKVVVEQGVKTKSGYKLFCGLSNCLEIDASKLDTSDATSMYYMFSSCSNASNIDVSGFNTSKVTSMYSMFSGCSKLSSIDVSGFDTSKVTSMSYMFNSCYDLNSLNVSNFDTSNVTDMRWMFRYCKRLETIDISRWNTSKVTTMSSMFYYCESVKSFDFSNFNTSNVTDMEDMFFKCSSLTELDLRSFDTSKVTKMCSGSENDFDACWGMFSQCSSLKQLDISSFNTSRVTRFSYMFMGCSSLEELDISSLNTTNISTNALTALRGMFANCTSLKSIDVSSIDTTNATSIMRMFANCISLTSLDLSSWNMTNVRVLMQDHENTMTFYGCTNLSRLTINGTFKFKTSATSNYWGKPNTPPTNNRYTGKWIRDDKAYGPYTPIQFRDNYTPEMAGTWIWEEIPLEYHVRYSFNDFIPEGASELPTERTYHQGDEVNVAENATAPGYTFSGWSRTGTFEMPGEDVEITGSFTARTDTQYKVEHYLEDLNADTYTLKKIDDLTGKTDTEISAVAKDYEGFTMNASIEGSFQSGTIKGDGSLVLRLYYNRNSYNVSYSYTGDIPEDVSNLPQNETYEYGDEIIVQDDATAEGYTFSGWIKDYITMPAHDIEITGYFIENPKSYRYKVEYFFDGELDETLDEILNAEKDEEISLTPQTPLKHREKNYTLVSNNHKITISINDEDNIINVYYETDVLDYEIDNSEDTAEGDGIPDKYQIQINYKVENGLWEDGTEETKKEIVTLKDKDGNYSEEGEGNTKIPSVGSKPYDGYTVGRWNKIVPSKVSSKDNGDEYIYSYEKISKADIVKLGGKGSNPKTDDVFHRYLIYYGLGTLVLMAVIRIRRKYSRKARKIQF